MIGVVCSLLAVTALAIWIARGVWREFARLQALEADAERDRLTQLEAFSRALRLLHPGHIPWAEIADIRRSGRERASVAATDLLLDRYDDGPQGVVVGHAAALDADRARWPFVAARHRARGYPPAWTITDATLPVVLPDTLRCRHLYIVGKSGSGKTTLIRNLALQDMADGAGVGILAPEAELIREELLPFIPEERLDDVVYVDPSDTARPVAVNPLHVDPHEDLDLKLDETLSIFHRLIAEDGSGAPRMETILRYTLYTLMSIPGSTLLDIPRLLDRTDDGFRSWAVGRIESEEVRHFWTAIYPSFPKDAHLSLWNRLGRFLQPRIVRSMLCQPGASLNVRSAMDEGRIVLVNLSDGLLGEQNALLLGQLLVAKFQTAAMSRADIPKDRRRRFHLYVDEFQAFCGVAGTSYERMLSRARKYGLSLVLAHQQTGQIGEGTMREILGNVGSLVVFRVGATDARRFGRELAGTCPGFGHETLTSLAVGEAACLFDRTFMIAKTSPPPTGGSAAIRTEAIRGSRERFGVVPGTVARPHAASAFEDLAAGDVFGG